LIVKLKKLKRIIENDDTKAGKIFNWFIQFLIILSLISFTIESLPNLSKKTRDILYSIEVFTIITFTIEYILRLIVADKKLRFIFSFYGLIDLFAFLPFYITTGIDLRSIRIFRLFRLFRLLKILRYNKAIQRFKLAFRSIKEELILFFITTMFLVYVSSIGIYYCEYESQPDQFSSILHSFWWAIVTLTTVGYGDVYPITVCGKILASFVMLIGIGIVAIPSGLIASALTKVIRDEDDENKSQAKK